MTGFRPRSARCGLRAMARRALLALVLVGAGAVHAGCARADTGDGRQPFAAWLDALRAEATDLGLDRGVVDRALAGVAPIDRVIELDRRQPEFSLTFWRYLNGAVSDERVKRGREMLARHRDLLERVASRYGVQPRFLVAFWGLETNYGKFTGSFPVVGALATLAYDERRAAFFRAQLLAALEIMSAGDIPVDVKGSWAGAMGNFQFIPTTYKRFAVDFDDDGRRDMWSSLEDGFASAANYLSESGWDPEHTWGREVMLPDGFDVSLASLETRKSLADWQALGVRRADGGNLPRVDIEGSIVLPAGHAGPAFMVYDNFRTIMVWNRSVFYAIAVGHLSDRIGGRAGRLVAEPPADEEPLSRADVMEMQRRLNERGFETGGVDGIIGRETRDAVRAYQRSRGLPPDGYASMDLLRRLRGEAE